VAEYFTIAASCEAETRVKDSRFIAWLTPAASRAQAEESFAARAKEFAEATHNCYAFRIGMNAALLAYANDGHEPPGSAGRPMLQALEARKLTNVLAVVTRYFGGTKLGVGGLIRAYSGAVQTALANATLLPLIPMCSFHLRYQYSDSAQVESVLRKFEAKAIAQDFAAHVERRVEVAAEHAEEFVLALNERCGGRVGITRS
jgi:uncharacterized YigZ family protein